MPVRPSRGLLARALALVVMAWCLALPLRDVLAYPDRISVLPNLQVDAEAYASIAGQLASTWCLSDLPSKHPPGWIALLAAVFSIAGPSYVAGKFVSWAALVMMVAGCAWLASRIFGSTAGWMAALVCASSPALRAYVGTLQYEVVTAAMLVLMLVLAVRAADAASAPSLYRRSALAGLMAAALVLTREPFVIVLPLTALWLWQRLTPRVGRSQALRAAATLLVIAAAPPVVWSAVQSTRTGHLVTISDKGSIVFELGNNPLANGTYNEPLVGVGQPAGWAFIRQHPRRAIMLAWRKVLYFWGILRDGWNVPRPAAVWFWRATTGLVPLEPFAMMARGGWLLALFACAIWMLGRRGLTQWWLWPAIVMSIMAVHVVTVSSHRFAVPVLPVVFVLVSGPLAQLVRRVYPLGQSRAVISAVATLGIVVAAMQFQSWPLRLHYRAVDLDGLAAQNIVDPGSHETVRLADAQLGVRPIVLLADEYLPKGTVRLGIELRRPGDSHNPDLAAARVTVVNLDGRPACIRELRAGEIASDREHVITVMCDLQSDGPATVAVFSLGTVDLAISDVDLMWLDISKGHHRRK